VGRPNRLVLSMSFTLLVLAGCASGANGGAATTTTASERVAPSSTIAGEPVGAGDLQIGDCFNRADRSVQRVSCESPHQAEVYSVVDYSPDGQRYPGGQRLEKFGEEACYAEFQPFVGTLYELSVLDISVLVPSEADFRAGLHELRCTVRHVENQLLIGSMRNSGR
jgi:hypothetical protein